MCLHREALQDASGSVEDQESSPDWRGTAAQYRNGLSAIMTHHLSASRHGAGQKRKAVAK